MWQVWRKVPVKFEGVNQEIQKLAQTITETQREEMHKLEIYIQIK